MNRTAFIDESFVLVDADNTILDFSPSFSRLLGIKKDHLTGTSLVNAMEEGLLPEARSYLREQLSPPHSNEETRTFDIFYENKLFRFKICFLKDKKQLIFVYRTNNETLNKHEQAILDSLEDALYLFTMEGRLVWVNNSGCNCLGYSKDELLSMSIFDICPDMTHENWERHWHELTGQKKIRFETFMVGKNKQKIIFEISSCLVTFNGLKYDCSTGRDITDRKKMLEQLEQKDLLFRRAFYSAPFPMAITTLEDGRYIEINDAFVELLGYKRSEVIGQTSKELGIFLDYNKRLEVKKSLLAGKRVRNLITEVRSSRGEILTGEFSAEILELSGEPCILSTLKDITENKRTQRALAALNTFNRCALENIQEGIIVLDSQSRCIFLNSFLEKLTGLSPEEVLGKYVSDIFPEHAAKIILKYFDSALQGSTCIIPDILLTKNSGNLWIKSSFGPYRNEDGDIVGVIGILQDISERKNTEEKLKENEKRYRLLFERMSDAGFLVDAETDTVIECNSRAEKLLGLPVETIIGKKTELLFPPLNNPRQKIFRWQPAVSEVPPLETVILRQDGTQIPVTIGLSSFELDNQKIILGVFRDTSEKKLAEDALRASEEKYRSIFEASPLAYIMCDRDKCITDWNPSAENVFGWSKREVLGRNILEFLIEESDRKNVSMKFDRMLRGDSENTFTCKSITKNGATVICEWQNALLSDSSKKITGIILIGTDITLRLKAEQEKQIFEARLQQTQKLESLGVLAGGIAHDFNNLLVAILGNADLALMELPENSQARLSIKEIIEASRRAADLCSQMLAYSGKGRFQVRTVNINELIREMSHLLKVSISKKSRLLFDFGYDIPAIEGDITQLRQVIMNLVINASEAIGSREGVISIRTGCRYMNREALISPYIPDRMVEGNYVFMEISDTGCGMTDDIMQRIFDPFFTTKCTGRGLGMAAVLGIVRGHKGTIKVESTPDRGSTFTIFFPASTNKTLDDEPEKASYNPTWRGHGRVLLVDDDDSIQRIAARMLEKLGFEPIPVSNGRDAVKLLKETPMEISCAILDLTMPGMDGLETFEELTKIKPGLICLLSSGYDEADVSSHLMNKGFAGFLHKPYHFNDFAEKIKEALEKGNARRGNENELR